MISVQDSGSQTLAINVRTIMTDTAPTTDRLAATQARLAEFGQEHLLAHAETLDDAGQAKLIAQIEGIDWPEVARLIDTHVKAKPTFELTGEITGAPSYPAEPNTDDLKAKYAEAREVGERMIREGKVAAFCVAGGQGSRLGWDGPKGTYPASPIRDATLFQLFAEQLLKLRAKYGVVVPFYVMTSPINHEATADFFRQHDCFGLNPDDVMLFPQAMMPAIDMTTAKCLLAAPDELALSPNGHGGSLKALHTSGALADMEKRGIRHLSYVQVDNPLVKVVDPLFIGLHKLDKAQMSSKSLAKRDALEKVGNFALVDGKMTVIEYSNMPDELAKKTNADGTLVFNAGSIAIHVIAVDFVKAINTSPDGFALPWNRAEKKVAFWDGQQTVTPQKPNAIKLETFVFDALPMCEHSVVLETVRQEEFAPIKNADAPEGHPLAQDSPASSKQLQVDRAKRWLEKAGVRCGKEATVELKPTTAIEPSDLDSLDLPESIDAGSRLVI
ncbi:MAG: UDPGP type 1 family protein [Planctomycetota bacterium]